MKYIGQFCIIIFISFIGEILHYYIPLPIPASIYGLVIMFAVLASGKLSLDKVRDTGKFLVEIMPLMFIPAGVGLITAWDTLKSICVPVIVITLVSTIIVMAVSGRVTQAVIRMEKRRKK